LCLIEEVGLIQSISILCDLKVVGGMHLFYYVIVQVLKFRYNQYVSNTHDVKFSNVLVKLHIYECLLHVTWFHATRMEDDMELI
jgi:hypothetical protein